MAASQARHDYVVHRLLSAGAKVDVATPDGATALYLASDRGQAKVIKTLLSAGADVKAAKINSATSLVRAAQQGRSELLLTMVPK